MKSILALITFTFLFGIAKGQQEYLLIPADSVGTIIINESPIMKRITNQSIKVNKVNKFEGFRVEIYQGNDRKIAKEKLEEFIEAYPDVPAELVFENPYVKVKVGIYRSKLEAQPMFYNMKLEHEGAKIVLGKGLPFPPLNGLKKKDENELKVHHIEDF